MEKMTGEILNITDENIKIISKHFPEAMEEGKIKFDVLKELLGEFIDESNERYQFTWNGKSQALKLSQTPSTGTLLPCKEKSKDWETTENLYIEGDNLEVLKLLQKSYYKKIKMIYIDPPYNTGSDFIYEDDFKDNIKNYKEQTNQENKANAETEGRYHTAWLNMIYPRLRLAKNLLKDQGLIFISIDDNEVMNMKKICDEIFGENNFVANFIRKTGSTRAMAINFDIRHDYVLIYAKNINSIKLNEISKDTENYINLDQDPNGSWLTQDYTVRTGGYEFDIPSIDLTHNYKRKWAKNEKETKILMGGNENQSFEEIYKNAVFLEDKGWYVVGQFVFKGKDKIVNKKKYALQTATLKNHTLYENIGSNKGGSNIVKKLFEVEYEVFSMPKPVELLKYLEYIGTNENDIILDFFGGSSTTAHACMEQNSIDYKNRKYILVQLPEKVDETKEIYRNGYKSLCEIGEERIRRAGNKIKEESKADIDYGFKVFKLDSSNLKLWNGEFNNEEEANNYFLEHLNPLVDGRTNEDLLYELLLKEGMPLTSPIEEIKVGDKTIYSIGMGYLMICLEDKIDMSVVEEIGKRKPESIIFRDSGFVDENAKINTIQELKKYGIAEEVIKSI